MLALGTPVALLEPVASMLDAALLLSRVTGERTYDTEFYPLVLPRVRGVTRMARAANAVLDVQVAGGMRREHAARLIEAGAWSLALGAGVHNMRDMAGEVAEVRALAREGA